MCPSTQILLNISNHLWTYIIIFNKEPPKVFKFCYYQQRSPVGLEYCRDFLCLLLFHPFYFILFPIGEHLCGLMLSIQHHIGENISHLGNRRSEWLPSSSTTSVSHMWWCTKWTWRAIHIFDLPSHPPTGHAMCHSA